MSTSDLPISRDLQLFPDQNLALTEISFHFLMVAADALVRGGKKKTRPDQETDRAELLRRETFGRDLCGVKRPTHRQRPTDNPRSRRLCFGEFRSGGVFL